MGALRHLVPLVLLLIVVGFAAFIGYQIYLWTNELADRGKKKMEQKHVSFSKDGMRVGVKQLNDEEYAAAQQSWVVKAWNTSSFPAYKSRFWNKEEQQKQKAAVGRGAGGSGKSASSSVQASSSSSSSRAGPRVGQAPLSAPRETRNSNRASGIGAFPQD